MRSCFVAASCWFDRAPLLRGSRAIARHLWRKAGEVDRVPRCYFGQPRCAGSQLTCKMLFLGGSVSCVGFSWRVQFGLGGI